MAIIFLQKRKFQKYLIFIFLGIIAVVIFVLWQGFFAPSGPEGISSEVSIAPPSEKININFDILKGPLLQKLQLFSQIQPLQVSTTTPSGGMGRSNPFVPY